MTRCGIWVAALVCIAHSASVVGVEIPEGKRVPVRQLATLVGTPDDPMTMPTDVAVDSANRVFVADGVNNRVVLFEPGGAIHVWDGVAAGEALKRPTGLAMDAENRLWVADTGNERVVAFAPDGRILERIALPRMDADHGVDVTDLVATPDNRWLLAVDNDNHRLLKYDRQDATAAPLGRRGTSLGEFQWPFMLAVDTNGTSYVTEAIGGRVQVVQADGAFQRPIARFGVELGQLYRPKGIACDGHRLYVTDSTTCVVQVFGTDGRVLGVLTDDQGAPVRFAHPMGVACGKDGKLYIVELKADRVAVLELIDHDKKTSDIKGQTP